jgi:hypothetical protein
MEKNHVYINKTKKLLKYLVLTLVVSLSLNYIPQNKIEINEILMISSITSITFAILDIINPNIKIIS